MVAIMVITGLIVVVVVMEEVMVGTTPTFPPARLLAHRVLDDSALPGRDADGGQGLPQPLGVHHDHGRPSRVQFLPVARSGAEPAATHAIGRHGGRVGAVAAAAEDDAFWAATLGLDPTDPTETAAAAAPKTTRRASELRTTANRSDRLPWASVAWRWSCP
jgi:hypothetical protein